MRVIKFLLPILILALGGAAFYYLKITKAAPEPLQAVDREAVVQVVKVRKQNLSPMVKVYGVVESPRSSSLTSAIEADVVTVDVLEGNAVTKGQLLVALDTADIELELLQRQAEIREIEALIESDRRKWQSDKSALVRERELLQLSRRSVERARTLAVSSAGTQANLDEALRNEQRQLLLVTVREQAIDDFESRQKQFEARLQRGRAIEARVQRDLQRAQVKAPYDGRITALHIAAGDRVTRGKMMLNLYDQSSVEVRAQIPSRYLAALQQAIDDDQRVYAVFNHGAEREQLTLHRLAAQIDRGQGGVDAFFRSQQSLLPALGSTVELVISLPQIKDVVALPGDAMYGSQQIYRVIDSLLVSTRVQRLGQHLNDQGINEVLLHSDTLNDGDQVLVSRLPQAISGLKVKAVLDE